MILINRKISRDEDDRSSGEPEVIRRGKGLNITPQEDHLGIEVV